MNLSLKYKVLIVTVYTATCVAMGYYLVPVKTKIVTQTVEVAKKDDSTATDIKKKTHKETKIVEVKKPDGTEEKTITVVENTGDSSSRKSDDKVVDSKVDNTKKETVRGDSKVIISALFGTNVSNPSQGINYGLSVTKPILGPIAVGIFGLSNGSAGFSLGLAF